MRTIISLASVVLLSSACATTQATPPQDPRLAGAVRFENPGGDPGAGWIRVHLEGTPDRIGYQHGYLLAPEIRDLLGVVKPLLKQLTKKDWQFYRDAAEKILWPKIDQEYQQELDGIVAGVAARGAGATVDRADIVALNGMLELAYYYAPWFDKQTSHAPTVKSPNSCSAFIATGAYTKDHRIVIGHNAWTDYIVGSRWNIVFDIVPLHGHRMYMDG